MTNDSEKAAKLTDIIKSDIHSKGEKSDRVRPETLLEVATEFTRAIHLHGHFKSLHDGYAIMLEEFDELWEEIRKRKPDRTALKEEAIQVAAMAMKFVDDFCR